MFTVMSRFAGDPSRRKALIEPHKSWLKRGFDDGVFVLAGGLGQGVGGTILAHGLSREDLDVRMAADPFVAEGVATVEILEVTPSVTDPRLAFLATA